MCQRYHFKKTGGLELVAGNPVRRGPGSLPPCRYPSLGCPKGTPENSKAFDARNLQAWKFYNQCRATGRFPDDPIVAWYSGVIVETLDTIRATEDKAFREMLLAAVNVRGPAANVERRRT